MQLPERDGSLWELRYTEDASMTMIHAVQLARSLRVAPSLAYRMPLSRIEAALAAVSSSPSVGLTQRTLWEARQRKCGLADRGEMLAQRPSR
jgi:hypothetical protein